MALIWLKYISELKGKRIRHARNGGEQKLQVRLYLSCDSNQGYNIDVVLDWWKDLSC